MDTLDVARMRKQLLSHIHIIYAFVDPILLGHTFLSSPLMISYSIMHMVHINCQAKKKKNDSSTCSSMT
jgi:hypothetical protein